MLEWHRGRGFQHLKVFDATNPLKKDSGALVPDGLLPYPEVIEKLEATDGLPAAVRAFVTEKIREYARPERRFRPARAVTPKWLARLRFLDRAQSDR